MNLRKKIGIMNVSARSQSAHIQNLQLETQRIKELETELANKRENLSKLLISQKDEIYLKQTEKLNAIKLENSNLKNKLKEQV